MIPRAWFVALCWVLVAWIAPATAQQREAAPHGRYSERAIELAGSLCVQDGGRIKPLSTLADVTLLAISGRQSYVDAAGIRRSSVEFLLDLLYFPATAAEAKVFLVNDSAVIRALELDVGDHKKRDRYSFHELEPALAKLFALAHEYDSIDAKRRNSVQGEVVLLAERVDRFLRLNRQETLALVPPEPNATGAAAERWLSPAEAFALAKSVDDVQEPRRSLFTALDALAAARGEPARFTARLSEVARAQAAFPAVGAARAKVDLERRYYALAPLHWSLSAFGLAFVCAALGWLSPKGRWLHRASLFLCASGSVALVAAIVLRCMIRGRPPVSTLYETVLFVTAVGVILALVLEWFDRQRVAAAVAAFAGMVGLFIANGYERLDAKDTMPSLVAVLDTNFWLATHVTAIVIGYSAGLLAALLGSVYIVLKCVASRRVAAERFAALSRMVYGVLCFGLIFATVGTILGGIWANESWGRFWGWDPKENGALLIVISQLAILHGRLGGYLREFGLAIAAAAAGAVVAFSWWGVNLLGVGLHSYGFTSGIQNALNAYYGLQAALVLAGMAAWLRERRAKARARVRDEARSATSEAPAGASEPPGTPPARRAA